VKASTISTVVLGIAIGLVAAVLGFNVFFNHGGGKLWFYWIAPLLCIGAFFSFAQLAVMYWVKVGRLEVKGRPRQ